MTTTCLVTGGAGFIGCALSAVLPDHFDRVVAFDNLHPQIHAVSTRPAGLDKRVELFRGDVTSAVDWNTLLGDVRPTVVVHLAAETGTGQSLHEATRHAAVNVVGTTEMLDALVRHQALPEKVVLASSRAVYGEGSWVDQHGTVAQPGQRSDAMLAAEQWDFPGLEPMPFESSRTPAHPTSVYGATKLAQEHVLTAWCLALNVVPVIFRLQNVYGPGQSLTNPYTGIVSLFAQKAKAGEVIPVYEDGEIVRDFVFITDVADALVRGILRSGSSRHAYDIGSGEGTSILRLAQIIASLYDAPDPEVNGKYRNGDVRSATCEIAAARAALAWDPQIMVAHGVAELCTWIDGSVNRTGEAGRPAS